MTVYLCKDFCLAESGLDIVFVWVGYACPMSSGSAKINDAGTCICMCSQYRMVPDDFREIKSQLSRLLTLNNVQTEL